MFSRVLNRTVVSFFDSSGSSIKPKGCWAVINYKTAFATIDICIIVHNLNIHVAVRNFIILLAAIWHASPEEHPAVYTAAQHSSHFLYLLWFH